MTTTINVDTLDEFTRAYIVAALWSSTGEPFGDCAACDATDTILYWNDDSREHELCAACSGEMRQNSPGEPPLDEHYSLEDIAPEALAAIVADCAEFQKQFGRRIDRAPSVSRSGEYSNREMAGHDFWLTRNGHGCGFWDGDWPEKTGNALTAACGFQKQFGECHLYPGDDGRLYLARGC